MDGIILLHKQASRKRDNPVHTRVQIQKSGIPSPNQSQPSLGENDNLEGEIMYCKNWQTKLWEHISILKTVFEVNYEIKHTSEEKVKFGRFFLIFYFILFFYVKKDSNLWTVQKVETGNYYPLRLPLTLFSRTLVWGVYQKILLSTIYSIK